MKTPRSTKNAEQSAAGQGSAMVPDTTSTSKTTSSKTGHRLLALYATINHMVLRAWCAAPSSWGRATVRAGAEYTIEVAGNLPDSEVFSRPEFGNVAFGRVHGFGRDALVRKAGGMATSMYSTSRHPLPRLNNGALGSESQVGAKTMTTSPVASRSAAPVTPSTRIDPVALQFEAHNACAMASYYTRNGNHAGAARKAAQALAALRRLAAFERAGATA